MSFSAILSVILKKKQKGFHMLTSKYPKTTDMMSPVHLSANIFFSGIGAQEKGIENSNLFQLDVCSTSEIDKKAVLSYAAIHHNMTPQMVDIYKGYPSRQEMIDYLSSINLGYDPKKEKSYNWQKHLNSKKNTIEKYWLACKLSNNLGDISKIQTVPYADLWTISFPCFTKNTLVLSKRGYIPISELTENDYVLTKENSYEHISKVAYTGEKEIYNIQSMFFDTIETTENHKFLTRKRKYNGSFADPTWTECKKIKKNTYLGYAINQNQTKPEHPKLPVQKESFWRVIGNYIANGLVRDEETVCIYCKNNKHLDADLEDCKLNYIRSDMGDGSDMFIRYSIKSKEFAQYIKCFGNKKKTKVLPGFIFDCPTDILQNLLSGYVQGNGYIKSSEEDKQDAVIEIVTSDRVIAYGLGQIIAKVYNVPFSIDEQNKLYYVSYKQSFDEKYGVFYENGYLWFPVESVERTKKKDSVYDITVENSHSFTANGAIVHNCTDISVAGQMKGLKPDSGTKSSLLWENIRLLKTSKAAGTSPKYILFENVKNLVGKKFIHDFYDLLDVLEELGYNSYWQVLNGKDCGIPQNRERVFVICIRKDIDKHKFTFPRPFDTGVRLADMLEFHVDEKYYLSDEKTERFMKDYGNKIIQKYYLLNHGFPQNKIEELGKLDIKGKDNVKRVYSIDNLSPTLNTMQGGNRQPKILLPFVVASRGRNPINPSDRTPGNYVEQRFEPNQNGVCNTLTGVQKDNYVSIPFLQHCCGMDKTLNHLKIIQTANYITAREDRGFSNRYSEGTSVLYVRYLLSSNCGNSKLSFRIRKLTPTECGRLMGFTDEDVKRMQNIDVSSSSLYKQFGNSIITNCVELLAEHLYKAQHDSSYICTDEKICGNLQNLSNELVFVGGIKDGKWLDNGKILSRNFKQGYRVYDANGIACAVTTNGGGLGSHTGLYAISK